MLSWDSDDELATRCLLLGMKLKAWFPETKNEWMVTDLDDNWMFTRPHRIFYATKREAYKNALTMYYDGTPRTPVDEP